MHRLPVNDQKVRRIILYYYRLRMFYFHICHRKIAIRNKLLQKGYFKSPNVGSLLKPCILIILVLLKLYLYAPALLCPPHLKNSPDPFTSKRKNISQKTYFVIQVSCYRIQLTQQRIPKSFLLQILYPPSTHKN